MVIKLYIYSLLTAITLLGSTSCATINGIMKKDTSTSTSSKETTSKNSRFNIASKFNLDKSSNRGKRTASTTHAPSIITDNVVNEPISLKKADSLAVVKDMAGKWTFDNIHDISFKDIDDRPILTFDDTKTRFYAYNGCNYFNGDYSIGLDNAISFSNIIGTTAFCSEIEWSGYIESLWPSINKMKIKRVGTNKIMEFTDRKGKVIAALRQHGVDIVNGMWEVTEINGRTIKSQQPILVIDLIENSIHGNSGCNVFSGTIYQNPDVEMSMQFQGMNVTRHDHPGVEVETSLLVSLEQIERAVIIDVDNIMLADASGSNLIKLIRK